MTWSKTSGLTGPSASPLPPRITLTIHTNKELLFSIVRNTEYAMHSKPCTLVSGLSGPGASPGRGHCVVYLGKTLYSHSASLQPGV